MKLKISIPILATIYALMLDSTLHAEINLDQQIGIDFRSHPKSGLANYQAGVATVLYGKPKTDSGEFNPWYGGIRFAARIASILSYHETSAKIEYYPVSFLKLEYEKLHFNNTENYDSFDCIEYSCIGDGKNTRLGATLSLAYKDWFSRWQYLEHKYIFYSRERLNVIPDFGLLANSSKSKLKQSTLSFGRFIDKQWIVFYYLDQVSKFRNNGNYSVMAFFVGKKIAKQSFLLGAGRIDSELIERGHSLLLAYRWDIDESLFP